MVRVQRREEYAQLQTPPVAAKLVALRADFSGGSSVTWMWQGQSDVRRLTFMGVYSVPFTALPPEHRPDSGSLLGAVATRHFP